MGTFRDQSGPLYLTTEPPLLCHLWPPQHEYHSLHWMNESCRTSHGENCFFDVNTRLLTSLLPSLELLREIMALDFMSKVSFTGKVNASVLHLQLLAHICALKRKAGGRIALCCGFVCYETVGLLLMPQVIFNLKRSNSISPMRHVRNSSGLPGNSLLSKFQNRKQNWHLLIQFMLLTTLRTVPRNFCFLQGIWDMFCLCLQLLT